MDRIGPDGKYQHYAADITEIIYEEDVKEMWRLCEKQSERVLLSLIWHTGARPAELLEVKRRDVEWGITTGGTTYFSIKLPTKKLGRDGTFKVTQRTLHSSRPMAYTGQEPNIFIEVIINWCKRLLPEENLLIPAGWSTTRSLNRVMHRIAGRIGKLWCPYHWRHCLAEGDKIWSYTNDSIWTWKNIEDIRVGDTVYSPQLPIRKITKQWKCDGTVFLSKVISINKHFERGVYDVIRTDTGKKLYTCSKDHRIPLFKNGYKECTAKEISKMKEAWTYQWAWSPYLADEKYLPMYDGDKYVPIKCIKTTPRMVYGFTLDSPSGLFITNKNEWIITHNSTFTHLAANGMSINELMQWKGASDAGSVNWYVHARPAFIAIENIRKSRGVTTEGGTKQG